MGGIMRAPSKGVSFEIPYSGTLEYGDCILIVKGAGYVDMVARYFMSAWVYEDNVTQFSDENNVISFKINGYDGDSVAAFIPGPRHV